MSRSIPFAPRLRQLVVCGCFTWIVTPIVADPGDPDDDDVLVLTLQWVPAGEDDGDPDDYGLTSVDVAASSRADAAETARIAELSLRLVRLSLAR